MEMNSRFSSPVIAFARVFDKLINPTLHAGIYFQSIANALKA